MKKALSILILTVVLGIVWQSNVKAQPQQLPGECLKVRAKVTVKDSSTGADVIYEKGAIIAPKAVKAGACSPLYAPEIAETSKCTGTVAANAACWTPDFAAVVTVATVSNFTDWLFYILMLVVVLMIIYGGFLYVTAAGSPEKSGKGKSVLTFAIIGLAIALLAKIIPGIVKSIIGVS